MSTQQQIKWYRSPIDRDTLRALATKSDFKAFVMTGGFLGVLALLGTAFYVATTRGLIVWSVVAYFLYGTAFAFLINGFHELVHGTVFRTKWLNKAFLYLFSFLFWGNPHHFRESHMRHHKYTLHPPDDLEVRLPIVFRPRDVVLTGLVDVRLIWWTFSNTVQTAFGKLDGEWDQICFPEDETKKRNQLFGFARFLLVGHAIVTVGSLLLGLWQIPLLVTFAFPFGRWLHILCNQTQHAGLAEHTDDFRLSARTVLLSPVVEFLYWRMNYHIEHHMYASVPCYNLPKLHRAIRDDLPEPPKGIVRAWRHIFSVLERQEREPEYVYVPQMP